MAGRTPRLLRRTALSALAVVICGVVTAPTQASAQAASSTPTHGVCVIPVTVTLDYLGPGHFDQWQLIGSGSCADGATVAITADGSDLSGVGIGGCLQPIDFAVEDTYSTPAGSTIVFSDWYNPQYDIADTLRYPTARFPAQFLVTYPFLGVPPSVVGLADLSTAGGCWRRPSPYGTVSHPGRVVLAEVLPAVP